MRTEQEGSYSGGGGGDSGCLLKRWQRLKREVERERVMSDELREWSWVKQKNTYW